MDRACEVGAMNEGNVPSKDGKAVIIAFIALYCIYCNFQKKKKSEKKNKLNCLNSHEIRVGKC